ncbi:MAG: hypothetical protein U1E10_05160 [Bdellovibrionales bacterium]|nr:hypothetical protein [Bdellovibrionales bacterium]
MVPSAARAISTEGDLLSYSELMRLPHAKRVAYIEGVRTILVELSKNPEARFSDSDPRSRSKLKVWLESIDSGLFAEALADSNSGQRCLASKFCESALRSCFDQGQGIVWQEDIGVYKCNPAVKVGNSQVGKSSVFAPVDERAYRQYAEAVSDPRGKRADSQPAITLQAPSQAPSQAIAIVRPRPPATNSSSTGSTLLLQSLGVPTAPKRPGAQANSIEEYVELLAQGKIKGKRYSCRSKHQNRTYTNDQGEAIDHSGLRECTDEEEGRIQALYDRVSANKIVLVPLEKGAAPSSGSMDTTLPAPPVPGDVTGASGDAITAAVPFPVADRKSPTETFGRKISREEIQPYLDQRTSPDKICEGDRKTLGDGKLVFIQMADDGSFGRCMNEANAKLFQAGGIERHPSDVSSSAVPATPSPAPGAVLKVSALSEKFSACAPKPESCGDRNAIRKTYYQGKLPCVFAGMISNLDGQNRRCQAVTEYKIGSESLKCDNGQAMCNPLLFGTVLGSSPVKAICVGRGQDVTNQCGKLSNARDAELFINRNATGLQEKWDEFKTSIESVCKSETVSAKFHCHECNTMKQRLFELHAKIVGNPCETSLDEGIKTRIQNRTRGTKK